MAFYVPIKNFSLTYQDGQFWDVRRNQSVLRKPQTLESKLINFLALTLECPEWESSLGGKRCCDP